MSKSKHTTKALQQTANANAASNTQPHPDHRRAILMIAAFAIACVALIGGICAKPAAKSLSEAAIGITALTALLLPIVCLIVNVILHRVYTKKLDKQTVAEQQQFWVSQRDDPEKAVRQKLSLLKTLKTVQDGYVILLIVCALAFAFVSGIMLNSDSYVAPLFLSGLILTGVASRIRLKPPVPFFEEDRSYVSEQDFPALYALARKAAVATGCTDTIKIAVLEDFNAGVADIHGTVSIQLGALLLGCMSEAEVYCVLLHEFSHIRHEAERNTLHDRFLFLCDVYNGHTSNMYSVITKHWFTFIDIYYYMQYRLYVYAASLIRERDADQAMVTDGNREIAASALVKLKYYHLFDWEKGTYDAPCALATETYDTTSLKKDIQDFLDATERHADKWNELIRREILSRSASHPTLRMRLESLGVNEPRVVRSESSAAYLADCENAVAFISSLIAENVKDSYEEHRRYGYLEPKELVETWERDGRPLTAEGYRDIADALRRLGRNTEAFALCERAIEEFSDAASCYARFIKGCYLLHTFDETGIEYIYKAMEINRNYIEEGLSAIGEFCCLTGQEDQLDVYRQRAIELMEKDRLHSEVSVLNKNDRLSPEALPDGMLDAILAYITAENTMHIKAVYLVRKTISDDLFTSVFIIRMTADTDEDTRYKILHRAFNYLDTCSDRQFSLFDYKDVKQVPFKEIDGSCVYKAAESPKKESSL